MKLLMLHHNADLYGASKSLLRLTTGLVRDGHAVKVVLPGEGPLCNFLTEAGVHVVIMPNLPVMHRSRLTSLSGLYRLIRDAIRFRAQIKDRLREYHPDLVHTNTGAILPIAGSVARSSGIPHIQHMRESFLDFGPLWPPYRKWLCRHADRVICISSFIASMFTLGQREYKVVVVHNGIPREEFDAVDREKAASFRRTYAPDGPLIGMVGRIKLQRKGQDVFVRAAAMIKDTFPTAHFVIVGSPFPGNEANLDALHQLVRDLHLEDRVHFTGHTDEPLVAIAAMDISVMASAHPEPLGNVTIESMALGCPVIGTNVGGTTEIIMDGETGLLVPPNHPEAMAAAMAKLLNNPGLRQHMGIQGRKHYEQEFEFDGAYRRFLHHYQELTNRSA